MAVPKKKITSVRSGNRRGQIKVDRPALSTCSHCKAQIQPHTLCASCGYYRGKKVVSKAA